MKKLHEVDHPYYCSDSNYYSIEAAQRFETVQDFINSFGETDPDLNLCFRWDVKLHDDEHPEMGYYAEVFLMLQRKGIFMPIYIAKYIPDQDEAIIKPYLEKHWETLLKIWNPIS